VIGDSPNLGKGFSDIHFLKNNINSPKICFSSIQNIVDQLKNNLSTNFSILEVFFDLGLNIFFHSKVNVAFEAVQRISNFMRKTLNKML